jgi:hypothetical protein
MMSPREAAARAVAGVRAFEDEDWGRVLDQADGAPVSVYAASAGLCARLAAELRKLGGNPEAVYDQVACRHLEASLP